MINIKKNYTKEKINFPKIMESSEHTNNSYLATVLFAESGRGIVLYAHNASSLAAGDLVDNLDMRYFKDFEGSITIRNVV